MRVVILSPGADTGGQGYRIREAFAREDPSWVVRAVSASNNYIGFPRDAVWDYKLVTELVRTADVVHTKTSILPFRQFDRGMGKPVLLHHHGSAFRERWGQALEEADWYGAVTAVSTHDLMVYRDDIRWLPSPQDVPRLARMRFDNFQSSSKVRILHAPTNRRVKSTDWFLEVTAQLARTHDISVEVLEGRPWKEVLEAKASRCDIFYDQLALGYGQNALEAWCMGIPVVAGASEVTLAKMREVIGSEQLPFMETTPETLYENLRKLVESPDLRVAYGSIGHSYVQLFHDYSAVVPTLKALYAEAILKREEGGNYYTPPTPRGVFERLAPGVWRKTVRAGMWASVLPVEAARLEADYALGEPITFGDQISPVLEKMMG